MPALLTAAVVCGPDLYRLLADRTAVQAWVTGFGPWGPAATILLNIAQVILAPIPGQAVGLVNGYLYGVWWGTLYSLIGVEMGTALAMWLARRFGRPLVEKLVGAAQLRRWDRIARQQGAVFFFLVFVFPFLPDDVICFVIGLSPLSLPYMLLLAAVGRTPGLLFTCWVGANATPWPWWGWLLLGGGGLALATGFSRYHVRLEETVLRLVDRIAVRWR